jgi:hypothetical protein
LGRCRRGREVEVAAHERILDEVEVVACSELRPSEYALPGEAGLLERSLLGDVVDVRAGLDALQRVQVEQKLGQEALRLRPVAMTASGRFE